MTTLPRRSPALLLALALAVCASCRVRSFDSLRLCIFPALDRVVVEVHAACASDHKGATLSCTIERDGDELRVKTSGHDGRDPDDSCAADLTAMCESEPLDDGQYTVLFGDESYAVVIPNEDDSMCETEGG